MQPVVLKVSCEAGIHRIPLKLHRSGVLVPAYLTQAIATLFPDAGHDLEKGFNGLACAVKYEDEDGDLCTLIEQTFPDFIARATRTSGGRTVLKVHVDFSKENPRRVVEEDQREHPMDEVSVSSDDSWEFVEHLDSCSRSGAPEALEEDQQACKRASFDDHDVPDEIQAELQRAKAACEAEVVRHLDEWLGELQKDSPSSYEDWIAAVHPENVRTGADGLRVVDSRMYLEGSFHRQLWKERTALSLDLLSPDRRCKIM